MKKMGKIALLSTSLMMAGGTILPSFPPTSLGHVEAAVLKLANINYQTTDQVNLRTGAGTNYKSILKIPKAKLVIASQQSGEWYKVSYQYTVNGKKQTAAGWVHSSYLKKITSSSGSSTLQVVRFTKTTYQATDNVNIRSGAGTNYKTLKTVAKGKTITSTERTGNWYKVSYSDTLNGKITTTVGWMNGTYLKEYYQTSSIAGAYYFTKKTVNLYPSADTKNKAVYSLQSGNGFYSTTQVVNSIEQTWLKVSYNGKTLYVFSGDVQKYTLSSVPASDYQAKVDTYLYDSYGKAYNKLVKIPKQTFILVNQRIGDWYKVTFNGKSGFIYSGDFSKYSQPDETVLNEQADYQAITDVTLKKYPDSDAADLAVILKNTKFTPTHQTANSWYKVTINGQTGYVLGTNLKKVEVNPPTPGTDGGNSSSPGGSPQPPQVGQPEVSIPKATYNVSADLNFREGPGTEYNAITQIPLGTYVYPTSKLSDNSWYKLSYQGKIGYVSGKYIQQVKTGDPMGNRDSYQFIDLRTQSTVTAAQIDQYIASYVKSTGKISILTGKGQAFIDAGKTYGINALYLAAHAIHESAYGTSTISRAKNNLFGFGAYDLAPFMSAYRFDSVESCINYIAREIKATYLNSTNWKYKGAYLGFSTVDVLSNNRIDYHSEGMNFYYASDVNWGKAIAQHMEKILSYDKTYYKTANVSAAVPTRPAVPTGSDVFPANIVAIAQKSLVLNSKKGGNDAIKTISKGESFNVLEKTNDFWLRVKVDNKEYWTNDVPFDKYTNYISIKNLGRVITETLDVRSGASTTNKLIATLVLNDYVPILVNKDGSLAMDATKSWYQINLANGTTGWVRANSIYSKDFY